MAEIGRNDPVPGKLVAEAKAAQAHAHELHEAADKAGPGSPEWEAALEADEIANEDWEAASAVTSKVEGFTGGEPAE
jgi:hypothetical protein